MTHAHEKSFWKRLPKKWLFLLFYILLVVASNFWREHHPVDASLRDGRQTVQVREFKTDAVGGKPTCDPSGREITVAYRDLPGDRADAPVALVLHGTPGDSRNVMPLAEALRGKFRVIVPDLPGNGASTHEIKDYSIECAAHGMDDLLEKLGVKSAHVLGYGMGGGVALELSHLDPKRVKSLTLVSSVDAQEFDLMGNHFVNHLVYSFQMGGVKALTDFIPHFGLLDGMPVNKSYAHTLWESDLTPLKQYTRAWKGPLLLAHGLEDWAVAPDTAHYAKELAPHAETLFEHGGHRLFLDKAGEYAPRITDFMTRAEAGTAALAAPLADDAPMPEPPMAEGSRHWVLMLIILACTLVAEDPTCLATGLLVGAGLIDFWSGTAACLVGIFIGDLFLYVAGRILGRAALSKAPLKWFVSEYDVDRMSAKFGSTKGMAVIVSSRFIPGSRVPTFVAAGLMKLNPAKLGFLFFIAAALWTPPLVLIGKHVGPTIMEEFKVYHHQAGLIVIALLLGVFVFFHYVMPAFTWAGRRALKAKARRLTNHASMPDWRLGIPGFLHRIALALKYGNPAIYAVANPGLGHLGGVAGEEKSLLMTPFAGHPLLARFERIPSGDKTTRLARLAEVVRSGKLAYPLVIKPDEGENGVAVRILADEDDATQWFAEFPKVDALVQPRVSGREYEILWSRAPKAAEGRILAVVEKLTVSVQGDGKHTLERLIRASDTALDNAEAFIRRNAGREDFVPPAGENVTLSEIGSVAKGARVSVRHGLADAEGANRALNDLLAKTPGVNWVRLDVRAESDEAFSAGCFTVTEIEGAGRVSSAMRDAEMRSRDIHAMLEKQRSAAYAAGAAALAADPDARRPKWPDILATRSESSAIREKH